ncbi:hypothetical protein B484DRAFT_157626 [Ochromonadaceae sp. CCMP2298]|nr:hypothetical protein B484DRAFT_157626 [Ochromonadaceae sp. CCMP2298]
MSSSGMLPAPGSQDIALAVGLLSCLAFGAVCSVPSIWLQFFPKHKDGTPVGGSYLKAGEYGETEMDTKWSVFIEPLNAWTSLVYSVFGLMILVVGLYDLYAEEPQNRMTADAGFSLLLGLSCVYLGVSSFLFHASHAEVWRKADAAMTIGVLFPLAVFSIWDRNRLQGLDYTFTLGLSVLLLFSFTNGYVPYGSSDVVLPALVALVWTLEFWPRYGGYLHPAELLYLLRSFCGLVGGVLLRAADIKRNAPTTRTLLLAAYSLIVLAFALTVDVFDTLTLCGAAAGLVTLHNPARGHIFWHGASAYSIYIWWYALRTRPGDPLTPYGADNILFAVVLMFALKNAVRRIFMNCALPPQQVKPPVP